MKGYIASVVITLAFIAWPPTPVGAEGSWLDMGIGILESLNEAGTETTLTGPSQIEIGEAFKQALRIGTRNVVARVGEINGYYNDPSIHIPLPEDLKKAKKILSQIGISQQVDELELKMNRAAEAAAPKSKELFLQAIAEMTFEDLNNIYRGPEDSATKYFQRKMTPLLEKEMQPIIEKTLSEAGAIQAYDKVVGKYQTLPFVPDLKGDLEKHVVREGIEGIFHYLAKEEAAIRKNPARHTTELLKKVFGIKVNS